MKTVFAFLLVILGLGSHAATAAPVFSLQPSAIMPGQPAALRIDDADGCYEFDQQTVKRTASTVEVEILASDFVMMPCLAAHVTPILLPLGTFEAGSYSVVVRVCGFAPVDPCSTAATLALQVDGTVRRATIPAFGWIALLLSCTGILVLAFTTRAAPQR